MKGPIVIIVAGMAIVGLAVWSAVISLKFLSTASRAEGKVIDMAQTKEGLWSPVIEFVTSDGKTLRIQPDSASSSPQYEKGQSVDVLYKPDNPQTWRLKSFSDLWLMSVIIGALGVIVVVAGIGFRFMDNSFMAAKGHNVLLVLGVAVFGFIGILMLWGAWRTAGDTRKFLKEAAPATGKIVELRKDVSKDSQGKVTIAYYPAIEFSTQEGETITFRSNVAVDEIKNPVGENIKILYSRLNPKEARVDSSDERWGSSALLAVMGLASVTGALLIYFILYRKVEVDTPLFCAAGFLLATISLFALAWWLGKDSIYLTRHGERTTGIVVDFSPAPLIEFKTKDGKVVKYQSHVSDNPPKYSQGDSVPMLYDPSDPHRAVIKSFSDLWFSAALAGGFGVASLAAFLFAVYLKIRWG